MPLFSGSVQPSAETPVRMTSIGCDAAGKASSTVRTLAGKPRRAFSFVCKRRVRHGSAVCRGSADEPLLQIRNVPPDQEYRSHGNAGHCHFYPRCRAPYCPPERRKVPPIFRFNDMGTVLQDRCVAHIVLVICRVEIFFVVFYFTWLRANRSSSFSSYW